MNYEIVIETAAQRFLKKQPHALQERLLRALYQLPYNGDIKKLKGYSGLYRLRVGDYRIIYEVEKERLRVLVLAIGNRGEIYK